LRSAAVAQADIAERRTILGRRFMVRLGEWSFAFYLVHGLLIDVFAKAFGSHFTGLTGKLTEVSIMLALCTFTAALIYRLYERPLERRLRHSTRRSVLALDEPAEAVASTAGTAAP
jgi:peptidoglycan/LPS O-acetylase OafA/YrhL